MCFGKVGMLSSGANSVSILRSLDSVLWMQATLTRVTFVDLFMMAPSLYRETFSSSEASLMSPGPAVQIVQSPRMFSVSLKGAKLSRGSAPPKGGKNLASSSWRLGPYLSVENV